MEHLNAIKYNADLILAEDLQALETIDAFMATAPSGFLDYETKNNHVIYRQRTDHEGKRTSLCIPNEESELIDLLAQKSYYNKLRPVILREIENLDNKCFDINPEKKGQIYDELVGWKKFLVKPLFKTVAQKLDDWKKTPFKPYLEHPESFVAQTKKGEWRRSKSEADISDALDEHSDELLYHYEPELLLPDCQYPFHPDFKIFILRTGAIKYWEHAGGLGFDGYDKSFTYKIHTYNKNGIILGDNLIVTFEYDKMYLQPWMIQQEIDQLLR